LLEAMQRLAKDIVAERDFNKAAAMAVTRISMYLEVDACTLYVVDNAAQVIQLLAHEGLSARFGDAQPFPMHTGLIGLIATSMEPLSTLDMKSHPNYSPMSFVEKNRLNVFLGAPLVHNRECIGVIAVLREVGHFSDNEEGLLLSIATSLSPLLSNAIAQGRIVLSSTTRTQSVEKKFFGIAGSPGCGMGRGFVIYPTVTLENVPDKETKAPHKELKRFRVALAAVREDNLRIYQSLKDLDQIDRELFDAYIHILDDSTMLEEVHLEIHEHKQWAAGAIKRVFDRHKKKFEDVEDEYLSERADVFRDIAQQILTKLHKSEIQDKHQMPSNCILISEELSASMIAHYSETGKVKGIVSKTGSANAHTAILAKALGIPAVMGAVDVPLFEVDGTSMIVDGNYGELIANPERSTYLQYEQIVKESETTKQKLDRLKNLPAETRDGHRVQLWVNIGLVNEIVKSLDCGAEGIGLFRTEIPFAKSTQFPTESQQCEIYREHMIAFDPKPVTMRMLDIGGDKQLPYFPIKEENPFLGWRGTRITLNHPEIFLVQARAMLKAHSGLSCTLRILLPMVTNLEEIKFAKDLIARACREVKAEGFSVQPPQIGVLIEVPALVFQAKLVARSVDFLAVGSNDLTQYLLAVSRNNPRVANLYQEFHPAVLKAMRSLVKDAHAENKPIGICGEMAGTVEGAILLLGLGFDVLSMSAINIPRIKWAIRNVTRVGCRRIVSEVLNLEDANSIAEYVYDKMLELGLQSLVPHRKPAASTPESGTVLQSSTTESTPIAN